MLARAMSDEPDDDASDDDASDDETSSALARRPTAPDGEARVTLAEREVGGAREPLGSAPVPSASREIARARSQHEMHFFVSLTPCTPCGATLDAMKLRLEGQDDAWALSGPCPRCGAMNVYSFRTHGDPLTAPTPRDELGGASPSELISPKRWNDEIGRMLPCVRSDPASLSKEEWYASRNAIRRLLVCLNELLKFVPDGAAEIPSASLDVEGRMDRDAHPERYRYDWMMAARARCIEDRARHVAEIPRIEALERAASRSAKRG